MKEKLDFILNQMTPTSELDMGNQEQEIVNTIIMKMNTLSKQQKIRLMFLPPHLKTVSKWWFLLQMEQNTDDIDILKKIYKTASTKGCNAKEVVEIVAVLKQDNLSNEFLRKIYFRVRELRDLCYHEFSRFEELFNQKDLNYVIKEKYLYEIYHYFITQTTLYDPKSQWQTIIAQISANPQTKERFSVVLMAVAKILVKNHGVNNFSDRLEDAKQHLHYKDVQRLEKLIAKKMRA